MKLHHYLCWGTNTKMSLINSDNINSDENGKSWNSMPSRHINHIFVVFCGLSVRLIRYYYKKIEILYNTSANMPQIWIQKDCVNFMLTQENSIFAVSWSSSSSKLCFHWDCGHQTFLCSSNSLIHYLAPTRFSPENRKVLLSLCILSTYVVNVGM